MHWSVPFYSDVFSAFLRLALHSRIRAAGTGASVTVHLCARRHFGGAVRLLLLPVVEDLKVV